MNPKSVWGIIFIVLGVVAVIGGIGSYYQTTVAGNEILSVTETTFRIAARFGLGNLDTTDYRGLIVREQMFCIVSLVLGVLFCISGTLMIQDHPPQPLPVTYRDNLEYEDWSRSRFRM
jgi:hypothetical protein